eukprot:COSAG02_NODE_37627_length_439_cov_1.058824_1_plen_25_part_10
MPKRVWEDFEGTKYGMTKAMKATVI